MKNTDYDALAKGIVALSSMVAIGVGLVTNNVGWGVIALPVALLSIGYAVAIFLAR